MIGVKATAHSCSMMRPGAAQSASINPKQLVSAGPVQDSGARGLQGPPSRSARGFSPVDSFESGVINRRQPGAMPRLEGSPGPGNCSGVPSANDRRPAGDARSAAQIVDDTPVLKKLGRQKDIKFEQLCKQTGINPKPDLKDAKQNPDAVYRLAKVLEFIDSAKAATGGERSNKVQNGQGDGNIEGITKDGAATGYLNTLKGAAEGIAGSITKGRINPASLLFGGAMGALGSTEAAPQPVKDIANLF